MKKKRVVIIQKMIIRLIQSLEALLHKKNLFDRQDGHKPKEETGIKPCDHFEVNIGTDEEPRMVKVGKSTPIEERKEIIKLLREYIGMFWLSPMMSLRSIGRM
jgi:hypothetical protein